MKPHRRIGRWYHLVRRHALLLTLITVVSGVLFIVSPLQTSALTTVPTKMNFQGRLTNASGNIMPNGTYNMKLRLYTASSGGSPVWSEDRLVSASQGVTVTNGLFSIKLGDITSLPASLFASGDLYLEVELPTPATATSSSPSWTEGPMSPRNQMATSAYAFNSETLDGLDSADFGQITANNVFTGNNIFRTSSNSTSGFAVQNASNANMFVVDTSNSILQVGDATADGVAVRLVLDTKNTAGDPTGVDGAMYYNSNAGKFRCYQNSAWTDCIGAGGGGVTTIGSLDGGTANATGATISGSTLYLQSASGTNPGLVNTGTQTFAGDKTFTGTTLIKPSNSTTAFQVQTTGSSNVLTVDTVNTKVITASLEAATPATLTPHVIVATVDSVGNTGGEPTMKIGSDGYARIAYADNTNHDLKFAQCTNADCTTSNIATLDSTGDVGDAASLALGSDGYARIAYRDSTNATVKFIQCTNADCTTRNTSALNSGNQSGTMSLALGSDGYARISYYDNSGNDLKFIQCTNAACTTYNTSTVDSSGLVGATSSLALGSDGYARIAYSDFTDNDLKFAQCTNADCSTSNVTAVDSTGLVGFYMSLALGSDGYARITYLDYTNNDLKFAQCTNAACTTQNFTVIDSSTGSGQSITLSGGDLPRISYYDAIADNLRYTQCTNSDCTAKTTVIADNSRDAGQSTSLALGSDGYARIAYFDVNVMDLKFARLTSDSGAESVLGSSLGAVSSAFSSLYAKNISLQGGMTIDNANRPYAAAVSITGGGTYLEGKRADGQNAISISDSSLQYNTLGGTGFEVTDDYGMYVYNYADMGTGSGDGAALGIEKYGTGDGLFVTKGTGEAGYIARFVSDWSDDVFTIATDGAINSRNATNSANAFRVQDAGGSTMFNIATDTPLVTMGANTVLSAGKSLTVTGGNTASRPASPTEGMIYYDTSTKQLLTYANGKWQADRSEAVLVAASNSSDADKAAADYVADGNGGSANDGDQVQINSALTAGSGKKVVLLAGTYVADATILIQNNTTLAGVGYGTVIELADLDASDNLIENSNSAAGTNVIIRDLKLNGRKDLNTAGSQAGIFLNGMGAGTGDTARLGAKVANVISSNFRNDGITLSGSSNGTFTNNTLQANTGHGVSMFSDSDRNTFTGNIAQGNTGDGFYILGTNNSTFTGNVIEGNTGNGFSLDASTYNSFAGNTVNGGTAGFSLTTSSTDNTFTGNSIQSTTSYGFQLLVNSHNNVIDANRIVNSGGSTDNNAIYLSSPDSTVVSNNSITDSSATSSNYAINIAAASTDTTYLADNTLGGGSINDAGTGTVYGGQVNSSGNYMIQPAGTVELQKNTNVTGTLQVTGNVTASSGTLTVGTTSVAGNVVISDGSSNTATIAVGSLGGNYTYSIPVTTANDTFCLLTLANCGGVGGGVTTVGALDGGTANANGATISGTTIYLQSASGTNPGLVNTTTQTFAGNKTFSGDLSVQNVNLAAGKTVTITGDTTANRPGSPTEGMIYYDTTTKQLLTYANGKWQADRSTATKIVGTSASGGASSAVASTGYDGADYVNTSTTSAQTVINSAISSLPSTGGTVYLMEGTYIIDGAISLPSNVTLAGSGSGTVIKLKNSINADMQAIINSDTASGNTNITIKDLQLEGNKANNSSGNQTGIYFVRVASATTNVGSLIDNTRILNFRNAGIDFGGSSAPANSNRISNNIIRGNTVAGIDFTTTSTNFTNNVISGNDISSNGIGINMVGGNTVSSFNTITGNTVQANTGDGIYAGIGMAVTGNTSRNNGGYGIRANTKSTVTGNISSGNTGVGIYTSGSYVSVSGNTVAANGQYGIDVSAANSAVTGNNLYDNGSTGAYSGIHVSTGGDTSIITGNSITDTAGTGYAINILSGATDVYIANNIYSGTGAASINDAGTGTIYGGQVNSSTNYVVQPAGTIELMKNTNVTGTLQSTGNATVQGGTVTVGTTSTQGNLVLHDGSSNTATIRVGNLAGDYIYSIPVTTADDTFCMLTLANCGGSGVTTIGALDGGTANANGATIVGSTLYLQSASVTNPGFVNTTTQSFAGSKTFTGGITIGAVDTTGILLVLDTKSDAGDPTGVAGGMYYNSNAGKFRCYQGGAWTDCVSAGGGGQTRKITLVPEYQGAVISADGSNNNGTLTSDFDSTNVHNYYSWSNNTGSLNDYDVVVRTAIPSEYASGFGTFKIWAYGGSTSTSNNNIQVTVKDASGTACASSTSVLPGTAATWAEQSVTLSGCTFAANNIITITIKLSSLSNNAVRIGEMSYQYTN